jgi:predicted SprT family Zn-dependent metalloprotease
LLIDPNKTRLHINIAISILALLAIVGGVRAVGEEHRRTPEFLQNKYQELDRMFFGNGLPPVRIEWADLTEYNRQGETYREDDGTFVVLVDLRTNLRDEDLQDTVSHEMCHVATWRKEDDPRGSAFRACMDVIKGRVLQDGRMKAR